MLFIDDMTSGGSNFSKVYTYDPLDRLETYTEGEFGSSTDSITGSAAATETWGLDTYGNWDVETINGVAQYNTINSQNELTAFNSSSANQSFDPNGNTLSGSTGGVYIYNAWNQMTSETLSSVTQSFTYDALGQRITLTSGSTTQYQYYSSGGQVIETDTVADGTGSAISQYVWGLMYVNDLLVRDDNAVSGYLGGGTSDLGRRLFAIEDANFDVMGLVSGSSSGAVVVQRYEYTPYGVQTVYNISYGSLSSDSYHFGVGFQGGLMDGLTGLVHFDARDYDPVTGVWMEQDPIGYAGGGADVYQFVESNPVTFADPTGLYLAAFDGTWDRKQGAKDGPGIGNNGNHTVIQQFVERDTDPNKDYHAGVGTGGWIPGAILGGVFGIGSFTMVDEAFDKIKEYYSKKENQCDPVDTIGYSRGAYAALLFAQKVSEGIDEPGGKFHPKIRFIGLVSPVAQMALPNPFLSLHMGFPDQPPKGTELFVQALEKDGSNPIFRQDNLSAPDGVKHQEKEFDYSKVHGLQHQLIGSDSNVLDWLITEAQSVKVPVK